MILRAWDPVMDTNPYFVMLRPIRAWGQRSLTAAAREVRYQEVGPAEPSLPNRRAIGNGLEQGQARQAG